MTDTNSIVVGVTPTFLLRHVNYDTVNAAQTAGKYAEIPPLTYVPNTVAYVGYNILQEARPVGFSMKLGDGSTLIIQGREYRYNLCAHCRSDYRGYVGFGIPRSMTRNLETRTVTFVVEGEMCSPECAYSYYKGICKSRMIAESKYTDSETMLHLLVYLLWGCNATDAPDPRLLVPFGTHTPTAYRRHLHMIPEYVAPVSIECKSDK